jgi:hypothetical protein
MRSTGAASQRTSIAYGCTDNPVPVNGPGANLYSHASGGPQRPMMGVATPVVESVRRPRTLAKGYVAQPKRWTAGRGSQA